MQSQVLVPMILTSSGTHPRPDGPHVGIEGPHGDGDSRGKSDFVCDSSVR